MFDFLFGNLRKYFVIGALIMTCMGGSLACSHIQDWNAEWKFRSYGAKAVVTSVRNINTIVKTSGEGEKQRYLGTSVHADLDFTTAAGKPVQIEQRWIEPWLQDKIQKNQSFQIQYLIADPTQIRPVGSTLKFGSFLLSLLMGFAGLFLLFILFRDR